MTLQVGQRVEWNERQVEILREGSEQHLTTAQISDLIGGKCTRLAVIGKAHRLGIPLATELARKGWRRPAPMSPVAVAPPPTLPETVPAGAGTETVAILPVDTKPCCWPVGDPLASDFHFCGEGRKPGKPYCHAHCAVAYTPPKPVDPLASAKGRRYRSSQVGQWS